MPVAAVLTIGIEQELDGRWLAEVPIVLGALAYGSTRAEAAARAEALALRALAERIEYGEPVPEIGGLSLAAVCPTGAGKQALNGTWYRAPVFAMRLSRSQHSLRISAAAP